MSFGLRINDENGEQIIRLDRFGYCLVDSFSIAGGVSGYKDYPEFAGKSMYVTSMKQGIWGGHNTSVNALRVSWEAENTIPINNTKSASVIYVFAR